MKSAKCTSQGYAKDWCWIKELLWVPDRKGSLGLINHHFGWSHLASGGRNHKIASALRVVMSVFALNKASIEESWRIFTAHWNVLHGNLVTVLYSPFVIFQPFKSVRPVNMENLPFNNNNGQSYGYTLFETTITSGGTLNSKNNIRDRALVKTRRQTST